MLAVLFAVVCGRKLVLRQLGSRLAALAMPRRKALCVRPRVRERIPKLKETRYQRVLMFPRHRVLRLLVGWCMGALAVRFVGDCQGKGVAKRLASRLATLAPVSYTHLTLPTNREV